MKTVILRSWCPIWTSPWSVDLDAAPNHFKIAQHDWFCKLNVISDLEELFSDALQHGEAERVWDSNDEKALWS